MSKTLIFHDTYLMRGGAERMNIEIAKGLGADIATAIWSSDCYDARSMGYEGEIFEVDPGFQKGMLGFLKMKGSFFKSAHITRKYDSIFLSNEAITAIWNTKPEAKTYYYAHSISRHLFDQRYQYLAKVPLFARPFFLLFSVLLRWLYIREISKVGTVFVNSLTNKKRMSEWCGRSDGIVIYPSVDVEKFDIFDKNQVSRILAIEGLTETNKHYFGKKISQEQEARERENFSKGTYKGISDLEKSLSDNEIRSFPGISHKGYYISFSRLTHAKRIDTIIRAFQKMPDKHIIILYGEHDSQKDEFISLGKGYPNIVFHTLSDNNHLPHIISGAIASICISRDEDFGMVAIESMACGIPVIAIDEGGYRESMIAGETGYLIDPTDLEENLINIIESTSQEVLINMQGACRDRAMDFSLTAMNTQIQKYIR